MKKFFAFAGLVAAAAISLTNCQPKELAVENLPGSTLTVTASMDATKTTNSGMSTLWAEGDAITLFYATANGTDYTSAGKFTLSDGAGTKSGAFTSNNPPEIGTAGYDWYAIYPSGVKSPASHDSEGGYTYIGDTRGVAQEQYNDTGALCGTACPMYAITKNVPGGTAPGFTMKQIASVIEFNIVNNTGSILKVSRVTLDESEAGEAIVGSFYIDFTADPLVFTGSEGYVKNVASVSVSNPSDLANGETARLYLPVKPYTHDASKPFKVIVDGEAGGNAVSATVELNPSQDRCTFVAGKIKKVTVPVTSIESTDSNDIADVLSGSAGDSFLVQNALVTMVYNKGFFAQDETGTILVYMNGTPNVSKGDKVDINGAISLYSNMLQFNKPTLSVKSNGNTVSLSATPYAASDVDAAAAKAICEYVSLTATLTSATAATVEGATATLSLYAATDPAVTLTSGKKYNLTGYIYGYYGTKVYMYVDSAEEVTETPPVTEGTTVSMTMKEYQEGNNCTLSSGNTVTNYKVLDLSSSVRMMSTGTQKNCGSFWTSGSNVEWRLYGGGSDKPDNLIIKVADGCNLKSVKLTFGSQNTGILLDSSSQTIASGTAYDVSGTSVTYVLSTSDNSKTNGQIKITAVEIVYTGSGTLQPEAEQEIQTSISLKSSATVYIGETLELNATSNASEATITYESEDESIATVSSSGVVTGVAEGVVKIYARIAGVDGKYTSDEKYCNVTVTEKPSQTDGTWVETAFASIANGAQFVVVSIKDAAIYAMSNDKGTSTAPAAVAVTLNGNKLASAPASNLVWEMAKDSQGVRFMLPGCEPGEEKYLYVIKNNNGLRVGTNENNVIAMDSESGYLTGYDGEATRYFGVYNNQDWRCYTSVNSNIKDQTFKFYVKQ
jgi:hypothetical protein